MAPLRLFLKLMLFLIYAVFVSFVVYFPFAELLAYCAKEIHSLPIGPPIPIEDALLPAFALALVYAVIATLLRRIERAETPRTEAQGSDSE